MSIQPDRIVTGDCIRILGEELFGQADLVFADPPFNIGYQYDVYEDKMAYDEYYAWTRDWMAGCVRALKPTGTFWVAIGDEYAAEVRILGRELGLTLRNWVIWHYTFGQNTKRKFCRSHAHLFYFVKDPVEFTFHDDAVRVFSDRQREYHDRRANPKGKIPDDTWSEFPRVCGTFQEREGWHPCQMPETVLERIVQVSSRPGDVVYDPFAGSGTTLAVAKKLSRKYLGTELSADYVEKIRARLRETPVLARAHATRGDRWTPQHLEVLQAVYMSAAVSTDSLYDNPALLAGLTRQFNWRLAHSGCDDGDSSSFSIRQVWYKLEQLRRDSRLGRIRVHAAESPAKKVRPLPKEAELFL